MNNIERHTLELIGEDPDNPDVFTDDEDGMEPVRDSINDALEEISMVTGSHTETYYLALRKDRNFYRFAFSKGAIAWIRDVWLTGQKRRLEQTDMIRLTNFNPRWLKSSGTPQAYLQIGLDYIGVWPAPATDSNMLEITAVAIPARYAHGDSKLRYRKNWERAAAHYAAGEYFASRGDAKTAIYHHNTYLKKLGVNMKYPYATENIYQARSYKEPWPKATG